MKQLEEMRELFIEFGKWAKNYQSSPDVSKAFDEFVRKKQQEPRKCPNCRGAGKVMVMSLIPIAGPAKYKKCMTCHGTGEGKPFSDVKVVEEGSPEPEIPVVAYRQCPVCYGEGHVHVLGADNVTASYACGKCGGRGKVRIKG